ncbi:MAG: 2-hydroxychromene-2-carboxylate isomerase [Arenicella sp.]|nr:2-hydroxychromene-2-carboxylate isomerase [Arenicella sp.]
MSKTIEFYFDFGSPTAYLAFFRLRQLADQYGAEIDYRPVSLGGLFKATGNNSPVTVPAKGRYMMNHDLPRFSQRYGVPLRPNPFFPINTLPLMRGAIAAQKLACFDDYADAVFRAIWQDQKNMGDLQVIHAVLDASDLPTPELLSGAQEPEIKAALIDATEAAVERGLFGAPTMFIDEQMYFGQDRLDFIEQQLADG